MLESALRGALSCVIKQFRVTAQTCHHPSLLALKTVSVLPQSMSTPTRFYLCLREMAQLLRRAVDATVLGDGVRVVVLQQRLTQLVTSPVFPLEDDCKHKLRAAFAVLRSSLPMRLIEPPPLPPLAIPSETTVVAPTPPRSAKASRIPVNGYVLREVRGDGVAVLEGHTGLRKVTMGDAIPGAGTVRAIQKRGSEWVVVTSIGVIDGKAY